MKHIIMHPFKENGILLCRVSAQLQLYRKLLLTDRGRGATVPFIQKMHIYCTQKVARGFRLI